MILMGRVKYASSDFVHDECRGREKNQPMTHLSSVGLHQARRFVSVRTVVEA